MNKNFNILSSKKYILSFHTSHTLFSDTSLNKQDQDLYPQSTHACFNRGYEINIIIIYYVKRYWVPFDGGSRANQRGLGYRGYNSQQDRQDRPKKQPLSNDMQEVKNKWLSVSILFQADRTPVQWCKRDRMWCDCGTERSNEKAVTYQVRELKGWKGSVGQMEGLCLPLNVTFRRVNRGGLGEGIRPHRC